RGGIYAALGAQVRDDGDATERVVSVLRRGAADGRWVLPALARVDADWLVAHAKEVVPRRAIGGVLQNLPTATQRRGLLEALAPWPADDAATQLGYTFWRYLPDDEVDALKRILRGA